MRLAALLQPRQAEQKRGAGGDGRHVRRRRQHLHIDHQGEIEKQRGQEGAALVIQQDARRAPDKNGRQGRQKNAGGTDAEGDIAEQRRARADQPGDGGRMVEIAEVQMLGPKPVIGFIGGQRQKPRHHARAPESAKRWK